MTGRRQSERGYAVLMVFLMAAIIAIFLYQQLPRVAFETEREKEQLLIDRGEQYVRAIQLYYIHNNRQYPTSIDDLEKQEHRYLRRRYVDPYTGKDEWRIIHTNGGFLTDSLVQKPPTAGDNKDQSPLNASANPVDTQQPQVNAAVLQRPSDRPVTPQGGFSQPFPQQDFSAQNQAQPNNGPLPPITLQPQQQGPGGLSPSTLQPQQGGLPPITLQPGGNQVGGLPPITLVNPQQQPQQGGAFRVGDGAPGLAPGQAPGAVPGQIVPGQTPGGLPGQLTPGGLPGGIQTGIPTGFQIDPSGRLVPVTPPQGQPGQPQGIPGLPIPPQPGQVQNPFPGQPDPNQSIANQPGANQPGANQPGANQPGAQGSPNAALSLINQLLTNPRQSPSTPIVSNNNQIGAIAGIASSHAGPSIKVYKDQGQYEKWEFVFSPTAAVPGASGGAAGVPGITPGPNGQNQPGQSGFGGQPQPGFGAGPLGGASSPGGGIFQPPTGR